MRQWEVPLPSAGVACLTRRAKDDNVILPVVLLQRHVEQRAGFEEDSESRRRVDGRATV